MNNGEPTTGSLFLCHAEEDTDIVRELAEAIERRGYPTWEYKRDALFGISYLTQARTAIDGAAAVAVVISPRSIGSKQMTKEIVYAHENEKPFFPILFEISHRDFQDQQPEWRTIFGAITSGGLARDGVEEMAQKIALSLRKQGVPPIPGGQPRPPTVRTGTFDLRDAHRLRRTTDPQRPSGAIAAPVGMGGPDYPAADVTVKMQSPFVGTEADDTGTRSETSSHSGPMGNAASRPPSTPPPLARALSSRPTAARRPSAPPAVGPSGTPPPPAAPPSRPDSAAAPNPHSRPLPGSALGPSTAMAQVPMPQASPADEPSNAPLPPPPSSVPSSQPGRSHQASGRLQAVFPALAACVPLAFSIVLSIAAATHSVGDLDPATVSMGIGSFQAESVAVACAVVTWLAGASMCVLTWAQALRKREAEAA